MDALTWASNYLLDDNGIYRVECWEKSRAWPVQGDSKRMGCSWRWKGSLHCKEGCVALRKNITKQKNLVFFNSIFFEKICHTTWEFPLHIIIIGLRRLALADCKYMKLLRPFWLKLFSPCNSCSSNRYYLNIIVTIFVAVDFVFIVIIFHRLITYRMICNVFLRLF